jgi:hypothetical protein
LFVDYKTNPEYIKTGWLTLLQNLIKVI